MTSVRNLLRFPLNILSKLNGTVIFGSVRVGWSGFAALINIVLITRYLSPDAQGYFYTFYSFFQLQALTQAGFYTALLAELSHAWTRVRVTDDGKIEGSPEDIGHLGGLLSVSWRWHIGCSVIFALLLIPAGYIFFSNGHGHTIAWQIPWLTMSLAIGASFLVLPDGLALESSSRTSLQQKHLLTGTVVSSLVGFIALPLGAGLYTPTLITLSRVVITWVLMRRETKLLRGLPRIPVEWKRSILPLQLRISLSWILGYIVYLAFVPVAFQLSGPVVAGHLGVVMQICQAISSVAGFWLTRSQPQMGGLAATGQWLELHRLTKRVGWMAMVTAALSSVAALIGIQVLGYIAPQVAARFGSFGTLVAFLSVAILTQYVSAMVSAVRLAKADIFYYILSAAALIVIVGEFVFGKYLGELGYGVAFVCGIMLVSSPSETVLYYRFIARRMTVLERETLPRLLLWRL